MLHHAASTTLLDASRCASKAFGAPSSCLICFRSTWRATRKSIKRERAHRDFWRLGSIVLWHKRYRGCIISLLQPGEILLLLMNRWLHCCTAEVHMACLRIGQSVQSYWNGSGCIRSPGSKSRECDKWILFQQIATDQFFTTYSNLTPRSFLCYSLLQSLSSHIMDNHSLFKF